VGRTKVDAGKTILVFLAMKTVIEGVMSPDLLHLNSEVFELLG